MLISKEIPNTITEAIDSLYSSLSVQEIDKIKELKNPAYLHFTLGMGIRNAWGLWKENSPIKQDFIDRFGLFGHGDDISGIILSGLFSKCLGENVDESLKKQSESYKKHWKRVGVWEKKHEN